MRLAVHPLLPTIGWREWLALPDLGIAGIKAKVDTGARSSALHAFGIEPFDRGGRAMVRFRVHPWQHNTEQTVAAEAELIGHRLVRNSGGTETLRPVIVTSARLFDECWPIEITLIARDAMGFRLLLGREAVRRRFLVDASRSFLAGKRPPGVPRTPRRNERKSP